ncbi:unnamed protein product, partial [Ectocarpus sp. 4 AP-2014]
MRMLLVVVFFSTFIISAQETAELDWVTDFETAKLLSGKQDKPILMYFTGSDWCSPCKLLKKDFFNSTEFQERADKVVLLMVDIPRRRDILSPEQLRANKELVVKYNNEGSFPLIVGLNNKG